jgi:hypothetical protein
VDIRATEHPGAMEDVATDSAKRIHVGLSESFRLGEGYVSAE